MLDVRRMRVLKEVADRGSFSAAADALSYTQSAVSQQIAALEREAGARLVQRGARGIKLTEAGEVLVRHAEAILTRLADAEAELEALAGLRGGRLRLASFETAGATLVPLAVALFRQRHPAVEITLTELDPEQSMPLLKSGQLDLALLHRPHDLGPEGEEGLELAHLLDDPLHAVLPAEHPLASKARLRLKDMAGESWVNTTGGCSCADLVVRSIQKLGLDPHVTFESDDYMAIQGLVAAGVGVALVPALALTTVRDGVAVRSLGGDAPVRNIFAATLPGAQRSPATKAMLEVLQEVTAEYTLEPAGLAAA